MQLHPGSEARKAFPIFSRFSELPLAFLDTAASSQKPQVVIDRLSQYLAFEHANIHRGAYSLSGLATENYEAAREIIAKLIGAPSSASIIFTKGATESINLVAHSCESYFKPGDGLLVSLLEHHSNFVPWQMLTKRRGLRSEFIALQPDATINPETVLRLIESQRPKLLAITMLSNAFGSVVPLEEIIATAHKNGCLVLVDAAQAVAHSRIDVTASDCDFLVFSGHKLYGPTGIGVLYAKAEHLERMEPFQGGGGMIQSVAKEETLFAAAPAKFEAGTPPIAEAIALGTAVQFLESIGIESIKNYEQKLLEKMVEMLRAEEHVVLYGPGPQDGRQASIASFNVDGIHPHDLATFADSMNVQVRAGHHCAMPALRELGIFSTVRASLGVYSTEEDLLALREAIRRAKRVLR